jgi:zinc protease
MGSLMRSMDGPFAIGERLKSALEFGQTLEYYKDYATTIQTITPDRIRELANQYLQEDRCIRLWRGVLNSVKVLRC